MPRKQRTVKRQRDVELTLEQLEERARIGGILPDVPELTDEQREIWNAYRRSLDTWVPLRALQYAWARIDPNHGRGGLYVAGRLRRPDDPDTGDGWSLDRFLAALDQDRDEIADVLTQHPGQTARLQTWASQVEALGRQRETDANPSTGYYLRRLGELRYWNDY